MFVIAREDGRGVNHVARSVDWLPGPGDYLALAVPACRPKQSPSPWVADFRGSRLGPVECKRCRRIVGDRLSSLAELLGLEFVFETLSLVPMEGRRDGER